MKHGVRDRLKARDCCFCDGYLIEVKNGYVERRGCSDKKDFDNFQVKQGMPCFHRVPKYAWEASP